MHWSINLEIRVNNQYCRVVPINPTLCTTDFPERIMSIAYKKKNQRLAAIGSLLEICPRTDYKKALNIKLGPAKIRDHWEKTGSQLREAMKAYEK